MKPALTSTFGEYRPGRFHAGIDLKTWGREGIPIHAIADGYVWRVGTSPWGYGRVLYIKTVDGRTAVYAHLSRFAPRIASVVAAEQRRSETYSVRLFLKAGQIAVRRGEVLGYSGSTGIGVPHLHFELRDENQRPLNPLTHGFGVEDRIPPTILSLAVIPLDSHSRVDARPDARVLGARWSRTLDRYVVPGKTTAVGRIGVAVRLHDRADASQLTNRLAPYRLRLLVDGVEAYRTTYGTLSYDRIHLVELDRNFSLSRQGAGRYHNLYRETGNTLALYGEYAVGDGVLHAGPAAGPRGVRLTRGEHLLEVVAEDVAGNAAVAGLKLQVNAHPGLLGARARATEGDSALVSARIVDGEGDSLTVVVEGSEDAGETWVRLHSASAEPGDSVAHTVPPYTMYRITALDADGASAFGTCAPFRARAGAARGSMLSCAVQVAGSYAVIRTTSDCNLAAAPRTMASWADGVSRELEAVQVGPRRYESVLAFRPTADGRVRVTLSAVSTRGENGHQTVALDQVRIPVSGGELKSADGMAEVRIGPKGVHQVLYGRVEALPVERKAHASALGRSYRFGPDTVPLNGRAQVLLRYPRGTLRPEQLGVYELKADSTWSYLKSRVEPDSGTVVTAASSLSTYALFRDHVPPELSDLLPRDGGVVSDRRPVLSASLRDHGSGIGRESDIEMLLDGLPLIFEYDPEEDRASARPVYALEAGRRRLEVRARDMCGNETRQVSTFHVR